MQLAIIDWVLIAIYMIFSVAIALIFSKSSGKSLGEFFLGGRRLPWYLAGVSMVATTFAADTPLAVTELVYKNGISGNWLWWNMLIGGMLTTFFFARLWRRADVLTEVEFITLRYGGQAASLLRYFKAIYLGGIMNVLVIGWVNLAMVSIFQAFFGLDQSTAIWYTGAAMVITAIYSSIGGFMSVAVTDMFQFVIAMGGSIILAVLVLNSEQIGGGNWIAGEIGCRSSCLEFPAHDGSGRRHDLGDHPEFLCGLLLLPMVGVLVSWRGAGGGGICGPKDHECPFGAGFGDCHAVFPGGPLLPAPMAVDHCGLVRLGALPRFGGG
jgi:hypothetical protein